MLEVEIDFIGVFVHMGLQQGAPLLGPGSGHLDQPGRAGDQGAQGIGDLQKPVPVVAVVQTVGLGDGFLRVLGDGRGKARLVHGGRRQDAPQAGSEVDLGGSLHVVAACVDEGACARGDHFQGGQSGAQGHPLRRQCALKGEHDPGPDHREFVQDPAL